MATEAARAPAAATHATRRARAFRESLHAVLSEIAAGRSPRLDDIDRLGAQLIHLLRERRLAVEGRKLCWLADDRASLDQLLLPVAESAERLLCSEAASSVRLCGGPPWGLLFLDPGRGPGRRGCSMKDCGNRAKARRYYERRSG